MIYLLHNVKMRKYTKNNCIRFSTNAMNTRAANQNSDIMAFGSHTYTIEKKKLSIWLKTTSADWPSTKSMRQAPIDTSWFENWRIEMDSKNTSLSLGRSYVTAFWGEESIRNNFKTDILHYIVSSISYLVDETEVGEVSLCPSVSPGLSPFFHFTPLPFLDFPLLSYNLEKFCLYSEKHDEACGLYFWIHCVDAFPDH
jgi:hypothetical protein